MNISIAEAHNRLSHWLKQVKASPVVITRRGKRGRPRLGSELSTVESVRLDPELKSLLVRRAEEEGVPVSEVIRRALRQHLKAS
ncbi:MAG: ribbon-helix-helix protein, CopG family [Anaerolineales bacterium]|nr:ribbon-helix-helix protein, CopG family [Anaerolineales bacterium]